LLNFSAKIFLKIITSVPGHPVCQVVRFVKKVRGGVKNLMEANKKKKFDFPGKRVRHA
jgi:hypothetical protein